MTIYLSTAQLRLSSIIDRLARSDAADLGLITTFNNMLTPLLDTPFSDIPKQAMDEKLARCGLFFHLAHHLAEYLRTATVKIMPLELYQTTHDNTDWFDNSQMACDLIRQAHVGIDVLPSAEAALRFSIERVPLVCGALEHLNQELGAKDVPPMLIWCARSLSGIGLNFAERLAQEPENNVIPFRPADVKKSPLSVAQQRWGTAGIVPK